MRSSGVVILETLNEDVPGVRDVGKLGVWRVSSAKPGNGTFYGRIGHGCVCENRFMM
jgi:hypothetical protein